MTFLFTDIEGSTRLLHELGGDLYAERLAEHHRLLRAAVREHDGVEIDNQGDGFLFVFGRAANAVEAAEQAQRGLAPGPVRVRMGLHTGKPRLTPSGYIGLDLHKGSRIASAAHGGQILLSRRTCELVGAPLLDLGEHRLRDFPLPERIFQVGESAFPPLRTISNTNLPRVPSSFVGRTNELHEVLSLLRGEARLLTLSGPGGAGKSRLALEAAAEVVPEHPDGVFWVELAATRDPNLVTETIAQTLGAQQDLAGHVADRELLLVLDNFEQVVDAAADLSALLKSCRNLSIIVTSREVLRIRGEVEYRVPPLAPAEAVELFCARARVNPDGVISSLCHRLDDLPLAVELAAARTPVLSPEQILDRLSERLDLLRGGRDAEARQRTLRATLEWSHELLTRDEKRLFAALSVFAAGWTLESAEKVCGAGPDGLQSLVEKSLVRVRSGRFDMLETIREFARERLDESGETAELIHREGEWLITAADAFDADRERGGIGSLAQLEAEVDNIRATIRSALDWPGDPLALRLAGQLGWFWSASGRRAEGLYWTSLALERRNVPDAARAAGLGAAAAFASLVGDVERAESYAFEALELRRALGDDEGVVDALRWLGQARALAGEIDDARRLLRESMHFREKAGDRPQLARTMISLAYIELEAGNPTAAAELLERALELAREQEAPGLVDDALHSLGDVALVTGDSTRAARFYVSALRGPLAVEPLHALYCLAGLAAAAALEGRINQAGRLWGAIEQYGQQADTRLDASDIHRYASPLSAARGPAFDSAVALGRALTLDQVIEEACA